MPYVQEETVTVKLYKLHKGKPDDLAPLANRDLVPSLEAIVQELVGESIVVEVEKE
jgi:hypothetical protein